MTLFIKSTNKPPREHAFLPFLFVFQLVQEHHAVQVLGCLCYKLQKNATKLFFRCLPALNLCLQGERVLRAPAAPHRPPSRTRPHIFPARATTAAPASVLPSLQCKAQACSQMHCCSPSECQVCCVCGSIQRYHLLPVLFGMCLICFEHSTPYWQNYPLEIW